jgi:membrane-bound lytic murein transglycosylase A
VIRAAGAAALLLAALSGCAQGGRSVAPAPPVPPVEAAPVPPPAGEAAPAEPASALAAGLRAGPALADRALSEDQAARALAAFRISCPALQRRQVHAGIAGIDWAPACARAASVPAGGAAAFFRTAFEAVAVGDAQAFVTGYFEPEIAAARTPGPGYSVPVYRRPPDLIDVELGDFAESLAGRKLRGRVAGQRLVPYHDRAAIEDGALAGRGLELAWAADPIDVFFLQIQGSGRLRLPDGQLLRIGYDGQNGRDYVGIGALLRQRGLLAPGQASMQGIVVWLRANPEAGAALMRENKSFVFFRELTGPGPIGAMGLPVTPRATVAADPRFVPLGAPVLLDLGRADADGIWIAQDTGGAIKGANRFDTFWGAGPAAARTAGGLAARGRAWLLLPAGTRARIDAEAAQP